MEGVSPAVESVCIGVNAGIFPHPDPDLCHVYISCTFEQPIVYQCAVGLVFDPTSLRCIPGDREQCADRNDPNWNEVCATYSYAFFADPRVCWEFVFCSRGSSNRYTCLAGEVWSQEEGACLPGNRDTCEVFDIGNVCVGRPDGLVPHPTYCTGYLQCSNGATIVRECLRGEVFDPSVGRCVVGNTDTCEVRADMCQGIANDLRPHPNECHLFVFCSLGAASVLVCPPNEIFRPDIRFCVPGNRDTCVFSPVETACVGRPPGVVPHPTSCELFLSCLNGVSTVMSCPAGTIFNPQTGGCSVGDRETCLITEGLCNLQPDGIILEHPLRCGMFIACQGGNAQVNSCPPGEILRVDAEFCVPGNPDTCERFPLETMCDGRDGGLFFPHPTDCARFIWCRQGRAEDYGCEPGNIFSAPLQSCIPGNANTCTPLTGVCANQPNGQVLPHPDRCDFFIWCSEGRPTVNPCPSGEILRPDAQFCVPGNAQTCEFAPVDRMCLGQADSIFFPHPTDCAMFIACQGQNSVVNTCPPGSIYNAPTRNCIPGDQQTCQRFDGICVGQPDSSIAHPTTCTAYIYCVAGQATFEQCSQGTIFDPALGGCVTGNTQTCVRADGLCFAMPDGAILAHPNECDLYILCSGQQTIPLPCPAGEILNVEAQFCAPGDANTCQFHPVETMCQNVQDGNIYPHPSDCSSFVQCNGGQATVSNCPPGQILHAPSQSCRPGNTATCEFLDGVCLGRPDGWVIEHPNLCGHFIWCQGGTVSVQPCPPGEILRPDAQFCVPGNPSTCAFEPVERMCNGRPDGIIYPHPTDCRLFVTCQSSQAIVDTCRPGNIFRASTQSCVAGNGDTCTFLDNTCAGRPDGVIPHPEGCALFLLCTSGTTAGFRCPEGEILHPEFLTCAAGNADDCSLAPVTTEPPIISVCEGRPDGNYTHPLLCYLFIKCTNGNTDILSCPPNQIFIGAIRDCAPVCVGVIAGVFPHPDPSLCYVFITCTFEHANAYQCADGLVFDSALLRCVPGDREQCPERTDPDWDKLCSDVSYAYYAHPTLCWEFVFCTLGSVNRYTCPLGEIWSQRNGACLPGNWDTCELVELDVSCQGRPDGVLPHPVDCTSFLVCNGGQTTISECSRGEVFDQSLGRCVAGNTETCTRMENICINRADGTVLAHPNECDLFILCQGGQEVANPCPGGEILNVQAQFCAPGNADTCQFHPVETMCQNVQDGAMYPHPNSCVHFVRCIGAQAVTAICPTGQIFHAPSGSCRAGNTNTCELIGNVCEDRPDNYVLEHPSVCSIFIWCQGGTATLQPCPSGEILRPDAQFCVPGNPSTCEFEPLDRMCVGQIDATNFPHPTRCTQFVSCFGGQPVVLLCPLGSIYHAPTRSCVPGNENTCERFDSICVGRPDGIIPHPTMCSAFVYCSAGQSVFEQCSPGTIFKQGLSGCVVGNTDTCTTASNICTGVVDGTILKHPNECNLIVVCMAQQPGLISCPAGEIFNHNMKFCTPGDSKTCQIHPVETMCKNMKHGSVYPHPSDCTQFVRCNGEQPIVTACPAGHVSHPQTGSCRPGNTNTCEPMENVCEDQYDGAVLQHPNLCGHFVQCQRGQMVINICPAGEILRPDAQFCVPGNSSTCEFDPIDRMCLGQAHNVRFPHPTECLLYVACQEQVSHVQSCPTGSVYIASQRTCAPGNGATCERYDNICVGRPEGVIAHPDICTGYIHCTSNMAVFEQCAVGTIFDKALGGCAVGNTESCIRTDGVCVGQPNGAILAHPNECDLYILCVSQQAAPLRCPAGKILNQQTQICVPGDVNTCQFHPVETMCQSVADGSIFPHQSECSSFIQCNGGQATVSNCPPGQILHAPSQSCRPGNTATCEFLDNVCQDRPDGEVIEHPNVCEHFIWCQEGTVSVMPCPLGEILRPDAQFCVPGNASTCIADPIEEMCNERLDGRVYPHPTDCRQYLRCNDSKPSIESCRPGTIYRASTQSCVAGNGDTCTFLDNTCAGRPDGVIPHPEGCALFLLCTSGTTAGFRCPEGEILHPEFLTCAAGNADDCSLAPVTTEPPIISVCEGRPDGNYTHPLLCYQFIRCTNGNTDILSCPANQIFVGAIRDCAPGNVTTCIPM
uniref:Chitin-binding type-2 domain-containing protein n=1 Tax=Anopheles epiroticus TaxID=199890 RepID=A0A182PN30_9DIPT